jgi:hypothetical protein
MWKRFILWDYARASWQYDIIVALILAFIFLTPKEWFRDQPRIPHASNISMLPPGTFFVDTQLLDGIPENQRVARLTEVLQVRMSDRKLHVTRIEPILNSEGELQGYIAAARQ